MNSDSICVIRCHHRYLVLLFLLQSSLLFLCLNTIVKAATTEDVNLYCGAYECYDLLHVSQQDNAATIRKAYRKLSLQYHPDKSKADNAVELFREIARAYEVLSDPKTRKVYDYYLAHPEEHMYNNAMYYTVVYAPKTDYRVVLFGFLVLLSLVQYLSAKTKHQQALAYFRESDTVKRKALWIQEENQKRVANRSSRGGGKVKSNSPVGSSSSKKKKKDKKRRIRENY